MSKYFTKEDQKILSIINHSENAFKITVLNIKGQVMMLPEENIEYHCDLWVGKSYLNTTQKALTIKKNR